MNNLSKSLDLMVGEIPYYRSFYDLGDSYCITTESGGRCYNITSITSHPQFWYKERDIIDSAYEYFYFKKT